MGQLTNSYATTPVSEQDAQKVTTYNETLQIHDDMIAGKLDISTTGGTTTLTGTPAAPQAQKMFLNITGVLASNATIEIPIAAGTGRNRIYVVKNGTTGAFTLTIKKVGGTGVTVGQGNTAFLLYNGTDIQYAAPQIVSASGNIATSGTAFPSAPATNSRFFRTDRGIEYYYDGTRWLSVNQFNESIPWFLGVQQFTVTALGANRLAVPYAGTYDLWLVEAQLSFYVLGGTALGASHKWVTEIKKFAVSSDSVIATFNVNSGSSNAWRSSVVTIGALLGTTHFSFSADHTKTGTPGDYFVLPRIVYRLVG